MSSETNESYHALRINPQNFSKEMTDIFNNSIQQPKEAHSLCGDSLSHKFYQNHLSHKWGEFFFPTHHLLRNTSNNKGEDVSALIEDGRGKTEIARVIGNNRDPKNIFDDWNHISRDVMAETTSRVLVTDFLIGGFLIYWQKPLKLSSFLASLLRENKAIIHEKKVRNCRRTSRYPKPMDGSPLLDIPN